MVPVHSPLTIFGRYSAFLLGRPGAADRLDRAGVEHRAQREGHVGRIPHLLSRGVEQLRQALAAVFHGAADAVPAAFDEASIRLGEAGGGNDSSGADLGALYVARLVERRQHLGGQFGGFFQDGFQQFRANLLLGESRESSDLEPGRPVR
jgi:hypothetical protein